MKIEYSNYSRDSRSIIYCAEVMAEERNTPIDSVILFMALCEKCKFLCSEVLSQLSTSLASFIAEIEKTITISDDTNTTPSSFTDEAVLVLIKASYNALSNHVPKTLPIHILQAIYDENKTIQDVFLQFGISKINLSRSIEQYSRTHPYSWQSEINLDSRMSGYGFDVCNDPNISEFQAGYLINALEAYCDSGYLRNFTIKEKRLLSKLSDGHYHIGGLVSRAKKELSSVNLPENKSLLGSNQRSITQTESQHPLSKEAIEKRKLLKAQLLGKLKK